MRSKRYSTPFLLVLSLSFGALSLAQTVTAFEASGQGYLVVPVFVNGAGPYSFLLDTGSNRTLVAKEILASLGVASGTAVAAHMATGVGYVQPATVSSIAVGGMAVHDIEIEGIDLGQLKSLGGAFQGVLGEDFLKHFDVLIDNRSKTLALDDTAALADSLAGDRLHLSFSGMREDQSTADRLVFNLRLPFSTEPAHFLIDSGAGHALFFPARPMPFSSSNRPGGTVQTFVGNGRCRTGVQSLEVGKVTLPAVEIAFCEGMRANMDVDGVLPTSVLQRLFLSHAGAYAIVNPRLRRSGRARERPLHSAL